MQLSVSIFARGKRQQRRTVEAATRINRDGRTARVGWERKRENTEREYTVPWDLLGIVEGVVWFVARRPRAPPFSLSGTPPLSVLAPFSTATSVHSSCQKGRGAPFHGGGRAGGGERFSSGLSLSDGWFYPNAINSPTTRVYMPRGWNSPFVLFPFALSRIAPLPTDLAERRISSLVTCHRWRNVFENHSLRKEEENWEEEARRILKARGKCPFNNLFIEIFLRH